MNRNRNRILIGSAVLALILMSVWQHVHIVTLGYEIQQAQLEHKQLLQVHQQMRVEVETLSSLDRIEKIATTQLGMVRPFDGQVVLVEPGGPVAPSPEEPPPGVRLVKRSR